jgi:UDPglucose 6-dehydrogenase
MSVLILGSGVVGHATGLGLRHLGHAVTFVDIDESRIAELRNDGLHAIHADAMSLDGYEAVFVAVPTPSTEDGIVFRYLDAACEMLGSRLAETIERPLIVFRSTMPPGTTRERLVPALEDASGKVAGEDFLVAYNPEYLRAHNAAADFLAFRVLTIGTARPGDAAAEALRRVFVGFRAEVNEYSFEEAEFQKYVHNLYNALKISFFNEMRIAGKQLGDLDVESIFALTARTAEGLWNPQYGTVDKGAFGGACLPKDTAAWLAFATQRGLPAQLMQAASDVNDVVLDAAATGTEPAPASASVQVAA